jgi:alcohol dehydrogenase
MKALVYHGPGQRGWDTVEDPTIVDPTDAIVRIDRTTICGTDLHILKGDVPETTAGTILGHEAVGTVQQVSSGVSTVAPGDRSAWRRPSPRGCSLLAGSSPSTSRMHDL